MEIINKSEEYRKKLLDPRWQRKRLEVMQRDKFCCLMCGNDKDTLHIHHERYCKNPWDVEISDLRTLCYLCHEVSEICKKAKISFTNVNKTKTPKGNNVYVLSHREGDCQYISILHDGYGKLAFCDITFSEPFLKLMINTL